MWSIELIRHNKRQLGGIIFLTMKLVFLGELSLEASVYFEVVSLM